MWTGDALNAVNDRTDTMDAIQVGDTILCVHYVGKTKRLGWSLAKVERVNTFKAGKRPRDLELSAQIAKALKDEATKVSCGDENGAFYIKYYNECDKNGAPLDTWYCLDPKP